jgi:hypothetical protein
MDKKIISSLIDKTTTTIMTDSESEHIINTFCNNSNFINDLNNLEAEILKDGKIDVHDIPNIVLYVYKLMKEYTISQNNNFNNSWKIIKFIIETLIFTNIEDHSSIDIVLIDKLLDTSFELLKEIPPNIKKCSFWCCNKRNK